jgi:hypothetical protein
MSTPQAPKPAKLVIGLFMKEKALLPTVLERLAEQFGGIDLVSSWLPFDYTDYYTPEMGSPLFRRMAVFHTLIDQDALAEIKILTNEMEKEFSETEKRSINIDPGYLVPERLVLATGKNYTHRIYIGRGIYADLTLIYAQGGFQRLPWTYPDYGDAPMIQFLRQARDRYINDLKGINHD